MSEIYESVKVIQDLQQEILASSEMQRGYAAVLFSDSSWTHGKVIARGTMSGNDEWRLVFNGFDDLIRALQYINQKVKSRGYVNG